MGLVGEHSRISYLRIYDDILIESVAPTLHFVIQQSSEQNNEEVS